MEATRFDARARERDGVTVVELHGDLDGEAHETLERACAEPLERGEPVVLEFSGVDYINSTGIALIVGLLARARMHRASVRSAGLSEHYREIFEITRLADFIELHADEESAVASGSAAEHGR